MPNVYHVSSPSASLFSSTQQAGWYSTGFSYKLKLIAITAEYTGTYFKSIRNKFISDTTKESIEMIKIIERQTKLKRGKFVLFFLPQIGECLNGKYDIYISGFDYFDVMHFFPSEEEKLNKLRLSKTDDHYNRRGHEIAAKAIVDTLIDENIIDEKYLIVAEPGSETFGRDKNVKAIHLP
jgi:hypothetical protein